MRSGSPEPDIASNGKYKYDLSSTPLFNSLCIWVSVAVRWLVARGRNSEARALIQRAAKRNRVTIPDQLIQDMEKTIQLELCQETQGKSYTALDLFRSV